MEKKVETTAPILAPKRFTAASAAISPMATTGCSQPWATAGTKLPSTTVKPLASAAQEMIPTQASIQPTSNPTKTPKVSRA